MLPSWIKERVKPATLLVNDAAAVAISYNICFYASKNEWALVTGSVLVATIIFIASSYIIGRYSFNGEYLSKKSVLSKAAIAYLTSICILVIATWIVETDDARAEKGFIVPVASLTLVASIASHYAVCINQLKTRSSIYIVSNSASQALIQKELACRHNLGTNILYTQNISIDALRHIVDYRNVEIVIDDSVDIKNEVFELLLDLRARGMVMMNLKQFFERKLQRLPPEFVTSRWLTESTSIKMMPGYIDWRVKRFADCCGAIGLLILTMPLQLVAAICIKIEDGGPIFFSQIRTGLYGKQFRIWKLRSMKHEGANNDIWSYPGDSRVTRIGRLLRRTRIDELPQLYNVLKGEMSLIGPRPEQANIETELEREIENYRLRHLVRPGITGWAQTSYGYGSSVADSRIKLSYDLFYIMRGNWLLDLLITFKTIKQVCILRGI